MKHYITLIAAFVAAQLTAQKVKTDMVPMWCTYMPTIVLPSDNLTFSCVTLEDPANAQYKKTSTTGEGTNWNYITTNMVAGFKNTGAAQNPAVAITIRTEPFSVTQTTVAQFQSQTTQGMVTTYSYDMKAQYVMKAVAVLANGDTVLNLSRNQGMISQMNYPNSVKMIDSPTSFASQAQLQGDYQKNKNNVWVVAKKKCDQEFVAFLSDTLNSLLGYPSEKLFFEVATAKSKSFQYNDLDSAKDYITRAMDTVTAHARNYDTRNWSIESSRVLVQKAVTIWEKALTEESTDKKARIHPELAGYIRLNLALGYMMLDNYAKAEELYGRCANDPELGNGTQRNISFIQKKYLPKFKTRFEIHKGRL